MEKIDSILWMQRENPSNNGYLVINNRFLPNPDDNLYHLVNRKLLKVFSLSIFDEAMVNKYKIDSTNQKRKLGTFYVLEFKFSFERFCKKRKHFSFCNGQNT